MNEHTGKETDEHKPPPAPVLELTERYGVTVVFFNQECHGQTKSASEQSPGSQSLVSTSPKRRSIQLIPHVIFTGSSPAQPGTSSSLHAH